MTLHDSHKIPKIVTQLLMACLTVLSFVQGNIVYHGPNEDTLRYFSGIGYECEAHNNPPDFFLDVINGDSTAVRVTQSGKSNGIMLSGNRCFLICGIISSSVLSMT